MVRSTRVTVRTVLASLVEGISVAELVKDFPTLDEGSDTFGHLIRGSFHGRRLAGSPCALARVKVCAGC